MMCMFYLPLFCLFPVEYPNDWSNLLGYNFFVLFYECFACVCVYYMLTCLPGTCRGRKIVSDHWELELHMAMSHYMGAEN